MPAVSYLLAKANLAHLCLYSLYLDVTNNNLARKMHPLSRIPGFVIILAIGLAIIGYGISLELNLNWVIAIGIIFLIIAVLSISIVR